jgi:hypothetical protein
MNGRRSLHSGFLMTELIVSLTVLGLLLVTFAVSLDGFRRFNYYQLVRQRCISAGQATLDSIAATGTALTEEQAAALWPGIELVVNETDGSGQWEGLRLVAVTARGQAYRRPVSVRLARYFVDEQHKAEGQ